MENNDLTVEPKKVLDYDSEDNDNVPPPPPEDESDSDDSDNDDTRPPPPVDDDDVDDDDDDVDDDDMIDSEQEGESQISTDVIVNQPDQLIQPDDFDSDDDDDEHEKYLQKFDESLTQQIIADYHPEMKSHNYDEIIKLSKVTRTGDGVIIDPLHCSLPFITRYEKAKIIGERSKQLGAGATPFVPVDDSIIDEYLIALKEFNEKKIPFIVKRPMPNGGCEYWRFEDLEILI
jgi:DNA-directed RNA polymerase subunit K/omega